METPLPIYLGMLVHTKTRKRELVDLLFELCLSVSYDRVLEISTQLGHKVCQYYEIQRAVCPPQLKCGVFTTAAVDNIDHNLSSTSAQDSFHGTGISLFQHPDSTCLGFPQDLSIPLATADSKKKEHVIFIPCSWLEHLRHVLCTELHGSEAISWAAYHAQSQQELLPDGTLSTIATFS